MCTQTRQQLRNFKRITRLMHAIGHLKSHEELVPALPELQRIRDNQRTIIDMLLAHSTCLVTILLCHYQQSMASHTTARTHTTAHAHAHATAHARTIRGIGCRHSE
jgi:hypothetical protein